MTGPGGVDPAVLDNDTVVAPTWDDARELLDGGLPDSVVFRGCASKDWSLVTSLARLGPGAEAREREILLAVRSFGSAGNHAPDLVKSSDTDWHWLAWGQHHGAPTRLLDWTENWTAALHFAVTRGPHHAKVDAAVWLVDAAATNLSLPEPYLTAASSRLQGILELSELAALTPRVDDFGVHGATAPFVVFVRPDRFDDRMSAQDSVLSACSDPVAALDVLLAATPASYRRVVLPPDVVTEARAHLDRMKCHEHKFFPDPDGLGALLSRRHREALSPPAAP